MYVQFAYTVGKEYGISPFEIINQWGVPELIVAFGELMNIKSQNAYAEWNGMDSKTKAKVPQPTKYLVQFMGVSR